MNKLELGIEGYINIGNIVNVYFVNSLPVYNAEVLYRPGAIGECWRLKTEHGIVYVQMFERMDLIK